MKKNKRQREDETDEKFTKLFENWPTKLTSSFIKKRQRPSNSQPQRRHAHCVSHHGPNRGSSRTAAMDVRGQSGVVSVNHTRT